LFEIVEDGGSHSHPFAMSLVDGSGLVEDELAIFSLRRREA
jgi:hypothetical protein